MIDIVDPITRSRMMAGVKSKNTKPELLIRSLLHRNGFRFRIHKKDLPGKPDIVLPKYKAVIFIHGCFWHGHENCRLFKIPSTRPEFWNAKILKNKANDSTAIDLLLAENWRVCIIWECGIRTAKKDLKHMIQLISNWLAGSQTFFEIDENLIHINKEKNSDFQGEYIN